MMEDLHCIQSIWYDNMHEYAIDSDVKRRFDNKDRVKYTNENNIPEYGTSKYCEFLDENSRKKFEKLTVIEILKNGNNIDLDYVKNLDKNKEEIIACGTTLIGKKI